ncbi:MAG TPA: transposase [Falsiroseomonas sp.]|jgi:transposase|nr:transposase [Falsiroseomonas sp.]
MEIITGVERRRHWRPDEKLRILAELGEPGAKFVDVARRHEVSRGLLWQWRDAQRRGTLVAEDPTFVPVRVVPGLPVPASPAGPATSSSCADPAVERDDRIEIVLPDGTSVRVLETVGTAALRRVLSGRNVPKGAMLRRAGRDLGRLPLCQAAACSRVTVCRRL